MKSSVRFVGSSDKVDGNVMVSVRSFFCERLRKAFEAVRRALNGVVVLMYVYVKLGDFGEDIFVMYLL